MKYKTLGALVLAAGLGLSVSGCSKGGPTPEVANYFDQGLSSTTRNSILTGKIVKIQPSSISFIGDFRGVSGYHGAYGSENHDFEYVFVKDTNNVMHTLIYPRSYGIQEGEASVNYVPISGTITSDEFIKQYVNPDYTTDDNFPIYADGIITAKGIKYR